MISYALIGCGRIANNHIKAIVQNGVVPVAVCDLLPERMQAVLEGQNLADNQDILRYTDYKSMLREAKPNLVAIATESGKHAEIALDCIEAGCHVIVEKPIALSLSDADAMIFAAQKKGVLLCANHQNRFNPSIQRIRSAVEAGRFGKMSHGAVHVRWNRGRDYYAQAPWRGTWSQDGGALMNQSIHGIDLLRWMMGDEIEEVFAYTAQRFHDYLECEDVGLALVKFKNGALGTIEGTTNVYPKNLEGSLYLFGENGTVKAGGKAFGTVEFWQLSDEVDSSVMTEPRLESEDVYGSGHTPLYTDMIAAITENRPPYVDGQAGRRALELVLAIYEASVQGKPISFPFTVHDCGDYANLFRGV